MLGSLMMELLLQVLSQSTRAMTIWVIRGVTISDLAIFNFFSLRYDVASEVSPTWLTPVYL